MKNILFSLSLFFAFSLFQTSFAQQDVFSKVYDNNLSNGIQVSSLIPSLDHAYFMVGESEYYDALLIKADLNGDIIFSKIFKNTVDNKKLHLTSITQTYDSNFVLAGNTRNNNSGILDAFYTKIDANSDTLWCRSNSFNNRHIYVMDISQTADSGFIMCGYAYDDGSIYHQNYVAKVDSVGNLLWAKTMTIGNHSNKFYTVKQIADGSYLIGGDYQNTNPYEEFVSIVHLSSQGDIIWSKSYHNSGPSNSNSFNDFLELDNGYYVYITIGYSAAIMKLDLSGNILWSKSYNSDSDDYIYGLGKKKLHQTSDHSLVYVYGSRFGWGGITKIDTLGNILIDRNLFMASQDVLETDDHEFFIVGNGPLEGIKNPKGYLQIGIIQLDSLGNGANCVYDGYSPISDANMIAENIIMDLISGGATSFIPIEITSSEISITEGCVDFYGGIDDKNSLSAIQISPNPNKGLFKIELKTNTSGNLSIMNSVGQIILKIEITQEQTLINLSNSPRGVYYYQFTAKDNKTAKGKIIICD